MSENSKLSKNEKPASSVTPATAEQSDVVTPVKPVEEIGGPKGPDPTRFGDWSVNGRCIDF